jgi:hypothetical protein
MLKALVRDINEVDEALRQFYVEKDGVHYLNVTPVDGYVLDNVDQLKSTVGALRKEKGDLEKKVQVYGDLDPTKARDALKKVEEFAAFDPAKEADKIAEERFKAREAQLKTLTESEIKARDEKLAKRDSQVKKLLVQNAIKSGLAKLNPLEEAFDALEILAERAVSLRETAAGDFIVEVLDDQGNPRIKDAQGNPMGIDDFLGELRDKRPALFKADNKSGMDVRPGNPAPAKGASGNPFVKGAGYSVTKQMELYRTNPALAKQMKDSAASAN